jgi:hypothetical protein
MLIPPESYDPDWWKKQPGPYIPRFVGGVLGRWEVRIIDRRNRRYPVRTVNVDDRPAASWGHAVRLCIRANRRIAWLTNMEIAQMRQEVQAALRTLALSRQQGGNAEG